MVSLLILGGWQPLSLIVGLTTEARGPSFLGADGGAFSTVEVATSPTAGREAMRP